MKKRQPRQSVTDRVQEATKEQHKHHLERIAEINDAWRERYDEARKNTNELSDLLANLLALDPSLERFRHVTLLRNGNTTQDWDVKGIAEAVEFRKKEAIADAYAPKVKGKKSE